MAVILNRISVSIYRTTGKNMEIMVQIDDEVAKPSLSSLEKKENNTG